MTVQQLFLSPPTIGRMCGKSAETVRGWIDRGELKAVNLGDGDRPRWLVHVDDWQSFLNSRANTARRRPIFRRKKRSLHEIDFYPD